MSRFLNVLSTLVYAFCQFFFSFAALGQQPTVRNITIESDWGGLADSAHLKLFIHGRNGKFYLDEKVIESSRIEALLAALRSEVLPTPEASNLGITREWLQQNASTITEDAAPNQQALFEETFSNPKTIERLLPSLFRFWRLDDYPGMRITAACANRQR